ncbi:MAG: DUF2854 domain-containing protein [Thermostichales cyanobacterium SZTDM-1c_bins_54]
MFEKLPIPISNLVLILGVVATAWGFYEYNDPTLNLIGIFTGIPLLLGGITMKVVELKPVPPLGPVSAEVEQARHSQATEIQKQVRADITKYSYGANAHLEDALEFLGLEGEVEADLPKLIGYREELRQGRYTLVLRFRSEFVDRETWQQSYENKMQGFFGRDVEVLLEPLDNDLIELALVARDPQPASS